MRSFTDGGQGRRAFAPLAGDYIDARVLAANTVEKHTIPTGARFVVFSADATFYAKFGDTNVVAAVPAADVIDGTASMVNPEAREIPSGIGFISLIATAATVVTMTFYAD